MTALGRHERRDRPQGYVPDLGPCVGWSCDSFPNLGRSGVPSGDSVTVTECASASEASLVYQVLHGRGAGQTPVRYSNNTATLTLPTPSFNRVAGMAVGVGIHHDDLQHSTTDLSPSTAWFSQRVRQQQQDVNGMPRASRGTAFLAAAGGAGCRQQQSTPCSTTPFNTRPSDKWHRNGSAASLSWRVREQQQCMLVRALDDTACDAAAANLGPRQHQSTPCSTTPFNTSRHDSCASGGLSANRCARCPLGPDGRAVLHPSASLPCEAACVCTVCGSDRHMEHACFIAHGVPTRVKMRADKVVELCRLHGLYAQGAFDWRTTPTSLAWLLRLRVRLAAAADPNPNLRPDTNSDSTDDPNPDRSLDPGPHPLDGYGHDQEAEPDPALEAEWNYVASFGFDLLPSEPEAPMPDPSSDREAEPDPALEVEWNYVASFGFGPLPDPSPRPLDGYDYGQEAEPDPALEAEWNYVASFGFDPLPGKPADPNPDPDDMHGHGSMNWANHCDCEVCEPAYHDADLHGPGGLAYANHCDCEVCEPADCDADLHGPGGLAYANHCDCDVCEPADPNPDPDNLPPRDDYVTDGEGDGEGSEADGGYSSALEDGGMQLAELTRGLPHGARIPPQRITPAVARARWRARLGMRLPPARRVTSARLMMCA